MRVTALSNKSVCVRLSGTFPGRALAILLDIILLESTWLKIKYLFSLFYFCICKCVEQFHLQIGSAYCVCFFANVIQCNINGWKKTDFARMYFMSGLLYGCGWNQTVIFLFTLKAQFHPINGLVPVTSGCTCGSSECPYCRILVSTLTTRKLLFLYSWTVAFKIAHFPRYTFTEVLYNLLELFWVILNTGPTCIFRLDLAIQMSHLAI